MPKTPAMSLDDPLLSPLLVPPRLLPVSSVAHRLSASQQFVRRMIREQKLPAIRLGSRLRVDPHDLQKFIEAQRLNGHGHRNGDRA